MSTGIELSPEQQKILETCCSPKDEKKPLVRVTAAAGTGKTTTLLALAKAAAAKGHKNITYLTFNRSAAQDAVKRLNQVNRLSKYGTVVDGRTLHSCAWRLVRADHQNLLDNDFDTSQFRYVDDMAVENLILDLSKQEINEFLRAWRAPRQPEASREQRAQWQRRHRELAVKQVVTFIQKSLAQFCRSKMSLEELENHNTFNRDYYRATLYHKLNGYGPKAGFSPTGYTAKRIKFYSDEALRLFHLFKTCNVSTHDLVMKRAQLDKLHIPNTSLLLVDESQDLDGCQIDWAVQQHTLYGTHVYFVGDCAQSIYSFRGAKTKTLMGIEGVTDDCGLTVSWRFGENIARIANCALFCKENSPQTVLPPDPQKDPKYQKQPIWIPYRVTGNANSNSGLVTNESILSHWKLHPVTVIARTNAKLLERAVPMLGTLSIPRDDDAADYQQADGPFEEDVFYSANSDTATVTPKDYSEGIVEVPKFCINGKGQSSGKSKWRIILKQIRALAALFLDENKDGGGAVGAYLNEKLFPGFGGRLVTWESFKQEVENRELEGYSATISVVNCFKKRTLAAMDLFEKEVIDKSYSQEEADVILATCHSAKGMEWDNVELCDDFCEVWDVAASGTQVSLEYSSPLKKATEPADAPSVSNPYKKQKRQEKTTVRNKFQFKCKPSGDDINLIYVAITRAKRMLSINDRLWKFLLDCDFVQEWIETESKVQILDSIMGVQIKNDTHMEYLYRDLIEPLRLENDIDENQKLSDKLIQRLASTADDVG